MIDCYKLGTNPNKVCVWSCRKCGNAFTVTKVELVNSNIETAAKNTGTGLNLLL
jgi:ribosomal protein L37AE/L43A